MRERIIAFFLSLIVVMPASAAPYRAALVADMDTGRVLKEEHSHELNYPASLTKIMTLYLTFHALNQGLLHLDDYLIVSNAAANAEPVKLGLAAGSKITVEDAIKAVAVVSANDVARVLAENLKGGKEQNFAELMTRVATEIGLTQTNFKNSSGLPNDDHMSTAHDIALLSIAIYRHFPQYWKYFGIKTWTYNGKTYTNGNRLLGSYPGCDGMKTGFTNKSKYSLVATAHRDGHHLISVVLGAENKDVRASVATNMLNQGFAKVGAAGAKYTNQPATTEYYDAEPVYNNQPATYEAKPTQPVQTSAKPTSVSQSYQAALGGGNALAPGGTGVQFGAFSTRDAAMNQSARVKNTLGVNATIEITDGGMFRVRVNNISDAAAAKLKSAAANAGIDSFVFH